jgi:hypothetical protein
MVKIRLLALAALLSLFYSSLWAKKVDMESAGKVALHHVESNKHRLQDRSRIQLKHTEFKNHKQKQLRQQHVSDADTILYYVFNVNNDGSGGFVIVAGDDIAMPVLGYSDNGNYDENNLAPAFAYWMDCLQQEIMYAIENNLPQGEELKELWDAYLDANNSQSGLRSGNVIVPPLIETKWNQRAPYNDMCPKSGSLSTVTGCVATAMAQVMKYYNHPMRGTGQSKPYTTGKPSLISVPAVSFEVNYDWNNMSDIYFGSPPIETREAVATLMYHCGVSIGMNYQVDGSPGPFLKVVESLLNYFDYDATIRGTRRLCYTNDDAWNAMLKQQIDKRMPVLYGGDNNDNVGHAFICDGYAENEYFHFNWGWGGLHDGYFLTSALNPGTGGTGAGAGTYNQKQHAIMNIMPNRGGSPVSPDWKTHTSISSSTQSVYHNETFSVTAKIIIESEASMYDYNYGSGKYGIALVDENDKIVQILYSNTLATVFAIFPDDANAPNCKIPENVKPGNYKLMIAVQKGSGEWKIVINTGVDCGAVKVDRIDFEVKGNGVNLDNNLSSPTIVQIYPNPVRQGESLNITLPQELTGGILYIYDTNGSLKKQKTLPATTAHNISTSDLSPGVWLFHFVDKEGNHQIMKVIVE